MADEIKAPKVRIASAPDAPAAGGAGTQGAHARDDVPRSSQAPVADASASEETAQAQPEAAPSSRRSFVSWLAGRVVGHEHAVAGGVCGLLVALLIFAIGFFRTLLIVVLVVVGVAVGQLFDGDSRLIDLIQHVMSERRN